MKNKIKQYVLDQQFYPGFLGLFINPFYTSRRELILALKKYNLNIKGRTLDIGCGHKPYEKIFNNVSEYLGLEYDNPKNRSRFKNIDFWFDGIKFPFENSSFDSIILTQVFEHVFTPQEFLSEISRIIKTNGIFLISVPFVWDEHEQPHDYARYSSFALNYLLKKNGFEIISHTKTVPDIRVIFQLLGCYIHKKLLWIRSYRIRMFLYVLLISPLTIMSTLLSLILPKNNDLYLDNVILAKKIQ